MYNSCQACAKPWAQPSPLHDLDVHTSVIPARRGEHKGAEVQSQLRLQRASLVYLYETLPLNKQKQKTKTREEREM